MVDVDDASSDEAAVAASRASVFIDSTRPTAFLVQGRDALHARSNRKTGIYTHTCIHTQTYRHRHTDADIQRTRQAETKIDRQNRTDRRTNTKTDRQTNGRTDEQTYSLTDRNTKGLSVSQCVLRQTERQMKEDMQTYRGRQAERAVTHRQTMDTPWERQIETDLWCDVVRLQVDGEKGSCSFSLKLCSQCS